MVLCLIIWGTIVLASFSEKFSGGYPPGKPGNEVGDVPAGIPVSNDRLLEGP
jgi:hypothetical protein